jgi:hypothetical protein
MIGGNAGVTRESAGARQAALSLAQAPNARIVTYVTHRWLPISFAPTGELPRPDSAVAPTTWPSR